MHLMTTALIENHIELVPLKEIPGTVLFPEKTCYFTPYLGLWFYHPQPLGLGERPCPLYHIYSFHFPSYNEKFCENYLSGHQNSKRAFDTTITAASSL